MVGCVLLFGAWLPPAQANKLVVAVSDFCPFVCIEGEKVRGFTVDILEAIYPGELAYEVLPWTRAVAQANAGRVDAILAPAKSEAPKLIFPEQGVGWQKECFYTRKEDQWAYTDYESFNDTRLLVFKNWSFEARLIEHLGRSQYKAIFSNLSFDEDYMRRAMGMLEKQRADAFWQEASVFGYYALQFPETTQHIKLAGCIDSHKLHVAFTPKKPQQSKTLAKRYDAGFVELKETGRLQTILEQYGLASLL